MASGSGSTAILEAGRDCPQGIVRAKAQDILKYLGVNTDTDWTAILGEMARQAQG